MSFRALHSKYWVYCLFMVKDNDIQVFVKNNDKLEVVKSERAEIFFRSDEKLSPYYCLELDPVGRIFDYQAEFHRKFNTDWVWPTGKLIVKTNRTKDGYTVELAVHKQSLLDLRLLDKQKIQAAIFRAECHDEYGVEENMKWISWIKPKSEEPDFHIPSSFGILELEE